MNFVIRLLFTNPSFSYFSCCRGKQVKTNFWSLSIFWYVACFLIFLDVLRELKYASHWSEITTSVLIIIDWERGCLIIGTSLYLLISFLVCLKHLYSEKVLYPEFLLKTEKQKHTDLDWKIPKAKRLIFYGQCSGAKHCLRMSTL